MKAPGRLAKRLRRILLLLPYVVQHPGVKVSELAERLGVEQKDVIADLNLLFLCGLPGYGPGDLIDVSVEDDRVYVAMADYFSAPLRLTPPEALALYVGARAIGALPGMESADALKRGLEKLEKALRQSGSSPSDAAVTLGLDHQSPAHLRIIEDALAKQRRLRLRYFSAAQGRLTEREVDPWGLFTALGHWYLIAYDLSRDEERMFRTDRIKEARMLGDAAASPSEFDADRYRGAFVGRGSVELSLEISEGTTEWFEDYYPTKSVEKLEDGWTRVHVTAGGLSWAAILVLKLGGDARRVQPSEVQREAESAAARIASLYASAAPSDSETS